MTEAPYPSAEPPADSDWASQGTPGSGTPRYSASASVPVPPAHPAGQGAPSGGGTAAPYGGMPTPGQQGPYGQQFGQPAAGIPHPGGSSPPPGQARVAATASVPVPPQSQATQGHGGQGQGHGGGPGSGQGPAGQPPTPTTYGAPSQGYPAQPGTYGQAPQFGTYGSPGSPGGQGAPTPPPMGQGGYQAPSYPPPGPEMAREARDSKGTPTGGWPYVEQRPAVKSKRGLVITLIVVGALVVVGGAAAVIFALVSGESPYEVGACVKQQGSGAEIVDCSSEGAYRIASIVDNEDKCPDPAKPVLVLTGGSEREVACLTEAT